MVASVVEFRQNGYSTRYPTTPIRVPRAKEKLFKDLTAAYRKLHEQNEGDELFQTMSDILYSFCDCASRTAPWAIAKGKELSCHHKSWKS